MYSSGKSVRSDVETVSGGIVADVEKGGGSGPKLILAPMAEVTDAPMRVMCRRWGVDLCVTEMVSAEGLYRGSLRTRGYLVRLAGEGPLIAQLYGGDEAHLVAAAEEVAGMGIFCGIDLNAGCPVPKVLKCGGGAALMRDPEKIRRIVSAMQARVKLPISVKTRVGLSPDCVTVFDVLRAVEDGGGASLAVHGRFASKGHTGPISVDLLARVVAQAAIPVVVNGGILTGRDAVELWHSTGAAGLMVGRGAMGAPWIFEDIRAALSGCAVREDEGVRRMRAMQALREHFELVMAYQKILREKAFLATEGDAETAAVVAFRVHLFHYFKGLPGASQLRREMATCRTVSDVWACIERVVSRV